MNFPSGNYYLLPKDRQKDVDPQMVHIVEHFAKFIHRKHKEGAYNPLTINFQIVSFLKRIRDVVYSSFQGTNDKVIVNEYFIRSHQCLTRAHLRISQLHRGLYDPDIKEDSMQLFRSRFTGSTTDIPNLSMVSSFGHYPAVKMLLEKEPALAKDSRDKTGYSAFDNAVLSGNGDLVSFLWQHGGRPEKINPLYECLSRGYLYTLERIFELYPKQDLEKYLDTPLLPLAAAFEFTPLMQMFLDLGIDVNQVAPGNGNTALHNACLHGLHGIAALLLQHKADITLVNKDNLNPFEITYKEGHRNILLLIASERAGKIPMTDIFYECLFQVCLKGDFELVHYMLYGNIDKDKRDKKGNTIVHLAAQSGSLALMEMLAQNGFDLNSKGFKGRSPLHYAADKGCVTVMEFLIEKGCKTDVIDDKGNTPLFFTIDFDKLSAVEFLLSHEADVNHSRNDGLKPLMYALWIKKDPNIAFKLIQTGSDIHCVDPHGYSLLSFAWQPQYITLAEHFLANGVAINRTMLPQKSTFTSFGPSVLMAFLANPEQFEFAKRLIEKGANTNELSLDENASPALQVIWSNGTEQEKIDMLKFLFAHGAEINFKDKENQTLLYHSICKQHFLLAKYLLDEGIDVSADSLSLDVALLSLRNIPLAQKLFSAGLDKRNPYIRTILNSALILNLTEEALLLLNYGIEMSDPNGVIFPCLYGNFILFQKVLEKWGDPNKGLLGKKLIHVVFEESPYTNTNQALVGSNQLFTNNLAEIKIDSSQKQNIVGYLLNNGANINELDTLNRPPLYYALMSSNITMDVVNFLLKNGADPKLLKDLETSIFEKICVNGRVDLYDLMISFGYQPRFDEKTSSDVLVEICEQTNDDMLQRVLRDGIKIEPLIKNYSSFLPRSQKLMATFKSFDKGLLEFIGTLNKLVQIFSIEGEKLKYNDQEVALEGVANRGRYMSHCFAQSFKRFLESRTQKLTKDSNVSSNLFQNERMLTAIQGLETETSGSKLMQNFSNGQPVVISTGFTKHVFGSVWYYDKSQDKGYLFIANRGADTDHIGISMIAINPFSINASLFDQINKVGRTVVYLENQENIIVENIEQFWTILEKYGIERASSRPLIEQLPQQAGTCTHDNIKACIAPLGFIEALREGNDELTAAKLGYALYKNYNYFEKEDVLQESISILQTFQIPPELTVSTDLFEKIVKKIPEGCRIKKEYIDIWCLLCDLEEKAEKEKEEAEKKP